MPFAPTAPARDLTDPAVRERWLRIVDELTRRQVLGGALGAVGAAVLTGCGSSSDGTDAPTGRTVPHRYGTTRVPDKPERVVALGYTDTDALLAVGVPPVGIVDWFEAPPSDRKWEWQRSAFGEVEPEVVAVREEYRNEKILRLKPDLIVAGYSGMTKAQYAKLSEIAPVVAQPKNHQPFAAPWQVLTRHIARAVGQSAKAEQRIAAAERAVRTARQAHPTWAGRTALTAAYFSGQYYAFSKDDTKTGLLTQLGFTAPGAINAAAKSGTAQLSAERADLLDVDLLVWLTTDRPGISTIKNRPEYRTLDVAKKSQAIFVPTSERSPALGAAFSYNSALSIPYVIDHLVPRIESVLGS